MKKVKTEYIITYNELLEFGYTISNVASYLTDKEDIITFAKKINKKDYIDRFDRAVELLSDYMKSELKYFFSNGNNTCDSYTQIVLYWLINNKRYKTITDMYNDIKDISNIELIGPAICYAYFEVNNKTIRNTTLWEEIKDDKDKIYQLADGLDIENKERKKMLLEFISNAEECKQRLGLLLKVFYERIYKAVFYDIETIIKPKLKEYEDELNRDEKAFFRKYMSSDSDVYSEKLYIHISYSRFSGGDYWSANSDDEDEWIIIGCYTNEVAIYDSEREKILDFLKLVGEKKRIQIIEMLKDKPSYVDEIALKMNMTAPTASYHLTQLQSYDIVDYERYDHRFYYHLNNDNLILWFDKVKKYFER